jgi:hypothetical protein
VANKKTLFKKSLEVSKMPIHFKDLDVVSETAGLRSALIVSCNMCPAVTVSIREKKPFMQLLRSLMKSLPFEQYLKKLQSRLREQGIETEIFRSNLYHQWFMCMWTSAQRWKLQRAAEKYEAVIVLGCESATETVKDSVKSTGCKVVEGMKVSGIMNATLRLHLPCNVSFEDCRIVPISEQK